MRDMSLSAMVLTIPVNDRLRSEAIYQMQSTTDTTKQNVFRESVQIRDLRHPGKCTTRPVHRDGHVQQERQSERFEYQQLQRQAYEEQTDSGTEHFGDEEEPGTRA